MANHIDDDKYDEVFMQIAGQIGSVQGLLDKFFGFMHRKTDFYVEFDESNVKATMGFPIGAAEKMIIKSFRKNKMKKYSSQVDGIAEPYTNNEDSSITSGISDKCNMVSKNAGIDGPLIPSTKIKSVDLNSKGQQMPIGNGGVADNYYWTQTLTEVTVYIDAESASRGKEIDCIIGPKSLKLVVLGNVLIEGEFEEAVRVDESMWTLNIGDMNGFRRENSEIVIILEKTKKTWWKSVIVGHSEIDTTKVDSTQRIDEYDQSTQAALRKIMFDQKQKAMGLQTSEEMEQENLMKIAKNLPNSPF